MRITLKAVNAALPRVDALRREFRLYGSTGLTPQRTTLGSAYAEAGNDGTVSIRVYGVEDGKIRRDYYGETVNITEIVEDWMRGETDRGHAVFDIAGKLKEWK